MGDWELLLRTAVSEERQEESDMLVYGLFVVVASLCASWQPLELVNKIVADLQDLMPLGDISQSRHCFINHKSECSAKSMFFFFYLKAVKFHLPGHGGLPINH
ncbi:hypothetical protein SETIT_1G065100v2 [Setaria italica]|uniref:Uncharacterized protein n=1 Tax=Setaria italica TaxID=4555 RepID=A0A368PIA0_SETIT|nr:hypothetical protein SETIT_1G065100v2 [Setaria italica]